MTKEMEYILGTVYHIEGGHNWEAVRKYLDSPKFPARAAAFKKDLADAIEGGTVAPAEYVRLTDDDSVETIEDVRRELRLLWQYIYGNN